jgi:hypothetical protein
MNKQSVNTEEEGKGAGHSLRWRRFFLIVFIVVLLFCFLPIGLATRDVSPVDNTTLPLTSALHSTTFSGEATLKSLITKLDELSSTVDKAQYKALASGKGDWTRGAEQVRRQRPLLKRLQDLMIPRFQAGEGLEIKGPAKNWKKSKTPWERLGVHWQRQISLFLRESKETKAFAQTMALLNFSLELRKLGSERERIGGYHLTVSALKKLVYLTKHAKEPKRLGPLLLEIGRFDMSTTETQAALSADYRRECVRIKNFSSQSSKTNDKSASKLARGSLGRWVFKPNETQLWVSTAFINGIDFLETSTPDSWYEPFKGLGKTELQLLLERDKWWMSGNQLGIKHFVSISGYIVRERLVEQQNLNGLVRFTELYMALKLFAHKNRRSARELGELAPLLKASRLKQSSPFRAVYTVGKRLAIHGPRFLAPDSEVSGKIGDKIKVIASASLQQ